jgi:hypothetical protein
MECVVAEELSLTLGSFRSSSNELLQHRRKSPAWFGLQRKHAELAVADVAYLEVMRDNCKARTMINHK